MELSARGARVAVAGRDRVALGQTQSLCPGETYPLVFDVADQDACAGAVDDCATNFGAIDCLVNNAGIAEGRPFLDSDAEFVRRIMAVDFEACWWLTQAVLPAMLVKGAGSVIFVSSTSGKVGFGLVTAYTAAKHAQLGLMRSLAAEYAHSGVTFNAVCPYYADTPMTDATVQSIADRTGRESKHIRRALSTPQGRLVAPGDVAAVCALLAGPQGRGITGQAINVDGGKVQS